MLENTIPYFARARFTAFSLILLATDIILSTAILLQHTYYEYYIVMRARCSPIAVRTLMNSADEQLKTVMSLFSSSLSL